MTPKDRLWIIELYNKGFSLIQIEKETGFSGTAIKRTIEDYENGCIDAKGYKKNVRMGESNGEFKKIINPIEFIEKEKK